jgi:hypothetical protein
MAVAVPETISNVGLDLTPSHRSSPINRESAEPEKVGARSRTSEQSDFFPQLHMVLTWLKALVKAVL